MGKPYIGVSSYARQVKKMYVGVGSTARKVKKAYIGVGGVAKQIYSAGGIISSDLISGVYGELKVAETVAGSYYLILYANSSGYLCAQMFRRTNGKWYSNGSEFVITTTPNQDAYDCYCAALSSTQVMVAYYQNASTAQDTFLVTLTIASNSTITMNTPLKYVSQNDKAPAALIALTSTSALFLYNDVSADDLYAVVATVSGTTVSAGTATTIATADNFRTIKADKISSTAVLVVGSASGTGAATWAIVLSISGTTITAGTSKQIGSADSYSPVVGVMSATKAVVAWHDAPEYVISSIITISGTTLTNLTPTQGYYNVNGIIALGLNSNTGILSFVSGTTNQRTVQAINASGTLGTAEVLIDGISVSEGSAWYSGDDYSEMIKISDDTFDLVGDETVNMNLACIEIEGVDGLVVPNELS